MIVLGALGVVYGDFILEWTRTPDFLPAWKGWFYLHGAVLIVAGLGLFFQKTARLAALVLGAVWLLWTLSCIPRVMAYGRPALGGNFEDLALASGLFLLAGLLAPPTGNRLQVLIPRYAFAICLPVFGFVHFSYPQAVADFIRPWMPARLFWAYFTGIAFCAAGLAMLTGVLARLASFWFAIMITSWVLILHIPRVAAAVHDRHEWTTLFIAVAMMGGAWTLAASFANARR
jgi:uncharacterized membrane protein